jgi:hypothetical protein
VKLPDREALSILQGVRAWRDILTPLALLGGIGLISAMVAVLDPINLAPIGFVILIGTLSLSMGSALGFLFGIPKNSADKVADGTAGSAMTPASSSSLARVYVPNTALENFSDRLATIVVGVTLVQLKPILNGLWDFGIRLPLLPSNTAGSGILFVGITGLGFILGFAPGYLWARNELPVVFANADKGAIAATQIKHSADTSEDAVNAITKSAAASGGKLSLEEVRDSLRQSLWDSDPIRGKFSGSAYNASTGRVLSATWTPAPIKGLLAVTFTVEAVANADALTGPVVFHLHPTFVPDVVTVHAGATRSVSTTVTLIEGFTVGVDCDGGRTRLELDLDEMTTFPEAFKSASKRHG